MNYYNLKYKECLPEQTIKKIREIFLENNIEVEEEWAGENELGTYSLRIYVKGCNEIGANGKGTTEAYARASAYAEFVERIQNMMLSSSQIVPSLIFDRSTEFIFCKGERYLTAEEIIDENNSFTQMYMESRGLTNGTRQEKINAFLKLERMDYYFFHQYNRFLCIPFYSVKEKKYVYLPFFAYRVHYGSNGMSAGNTPEEALVQALSEVFERVVNRKTIYESISFPEIPDAFIKENYPQIYKNLERLRTDDNVKVYVKDCSCGGRYPVVGVYFVDKNTGCYGVKFGAHPNRGIALERCFTEATQGQTVAEFAKRASLDFHNTDVFSTSNLLSGYRTGNCKYDYNIFSGKNTYKYADVKSDNSSSNSDVLKKMLESLLGKNLDVLINDASYFGFPTYHVIVPTISETERRSDADIDKYHEIYLAKMLVLDVKKVNENNLIRLANALAYAGKRTGSNTLSDLTGMDFEYPAHEYRLDMIYLYAMCHFLCGNYDFAENAMKLICDNKPKDEGFVYDAIRLYFAGIKEMGDHNMVMEYLTMFYDSTICGRIDELFSDKSKLLIKQYPKMDDKSDLYNKYSTRIKVINHIYAKYIKQQEISNYDLEDIVKVIEGVLN